MGFYGEDLGNSYRLWIEEADVSKGDEKNRKIGYITKERVEVGYAGEWAKRKWRFIMEEN